MRTINPKTRNFLDDLSAMVGELMCQKPAAYLFLGLCVFISTFLFPSANIVSVMEARNCITAREIAESGNWLLPTLNGELRLAKPPLPSWITAVFGIIFGFGDIGFLRIPAALMTFVAALAIYKISYLFSQNRKVALIASLIFATTYLVIYIGRQASWDIYAFGCMVTGIYYLCLAWQNFKWKHFILAGMFMGCSFMCKGPAAFYGLLLPFLIAYFSVKPFTILKKSYKQLLLAALITIIVGFWWFFYILKIAPDDASHIFGKETSNWLSYQVKPIYYYKYFVVQSGIWAVLLVGSIFFPLKKGRLSLQKTYVFSLIWMLASLILLSVVPEKKTRYLLPVFFPSAILIGVFFHNLWQEKFQNLFGKIMYSVHYFILTILAFLLPVLSYIFLLQEGMMSFSWWLVSSVFFWINGVLFVFFFRQNKKLLQFLCMVDFMLLLVLFMLKPINKTIIQNENYSPIDIAALSPYKTYDYYCPDSIIRSEIVWGAKHIILPAENLNVEHFPTTPFLIFSTNNLTETLTSSFGKEKNISLLDKIDYNFVRQNSSKYRPELTKYIFCVSTINE